MGSEELSMVIGLGQQQQNTCTKRGQFTQAEHGQENPTLISNVSSYC